MIRTAYRLLSAATLAKSASRGPAPLAKTVVRRSIFRAVAKALR